MVTFCIDGDFLWRWGTDAAVNEGPLLQICVILCLKDINDLINITNNAYKYKYQI
jgi:hypothetical protein